MALEQFEAAQPIYEKYQTQKTQLDEFGNLVVGHGCQYVLNRSNLAHWYAVHALNLNPKSGYGAHLRLEALFDSIADSPLALNEFSVLAMNFRAEHAAIEREWIMNYSGKPAALRLTELSDYSKRHPDDTIALKYQGHLLLHDQRFEEAIPILDRAIQLRPAHGNLYVVRGDVYHQLGEHAKATEDYDRAIRLEPTSINYQARGGYRLMNDQLDGAMQDLVAATDHAPQHAELRRRTIGTLFAFGHADKALEIVDRYQKYFPDDINIHIDKMQTLGSAERHDEALMASSDALVRCASDFDRYRIYGHRVGIHDKVRDYTAALKDLEKMLTIYPEDKYALDAKVRFLAKVVD